MTIENIIKSVSYEIFVFFLAVCAAVDARLREREKGLRQEMKVLLTLLLKLNAAWDFACAIAICASLFIVKEEDENNKQTTTSLGVLVIMLLKNLIRSLAQAHLGLLLFTVDPPWASLLIAAVVCCWGLIRLRGALLLLGGGGNALAAAALTYYFEALLFSAGIISGQIHAARGAFVVVTSVVCAFLVGRRRLLLVL